MNNEHLRTPDNEFYEEPYIPSGTELSEYDSIPLRAVEAHSILVKNTNRGTLSTVDRIALQRIADQDGGDDTMDFMKVRAEVSKEMGCDDD